MKNTHGGVSLSATILKLTLFHGYFSRFLNCTNVTKSRNPSHLRCRIFFHREPTSYQPSLMFGFTKTRMSASFDNAFSNMKTKLSSKSFNTWKRSFVAAHMIARDWLYLFDFAIQSKAVCKNGCCLATSCVLYQVNKHFSMAVS